MSASSRRQRVKQAVVGEAATHAVRAANADGARDYIETQLGDARQLNSQKFGDEHLTDDERERRHAKHRSRRQPSRLAKFGQNVDLVGLAIALVVVGVVMYVGLNVMSTTEQSAGLDTSADPGNRSQFENASADLTGGISDAYSLSGILFLVLILTGVVGLLLGLRGRR